MWAFQRSAEAPSVENPSAFQSHSLQSSDSSAELRLPRFSTVSVTVPQKMATLQYSFDPGQGCLDLQMFFSLDPLPTDLIFGEGYLRLGLGAIPNDLNGYLSPGLLPSSRDLRFQLESFYKAHGLADSDQVFLNLFCPFWRADDLGEGINLDLKFAPFEPVELDFYQQSQAEFVKATGRFPGFAVALFADYFDGSAEPPVTTETLELLHSQGQIAKVR